MYIFSRLQNLVKLLFYKNPTISINGIKISFSEDTLKITSKYYIQEYDAGYINCSEEFITYCSKEKPDSFIEDEIVSHPNDIPNILSECKLEDEF